MSRVGFIIVGLLLALGAIAQAMPGSGDRSQQRYAERVYARCMAAEVGPYAADFERELTARACNVEANTARNGADAAILRGDYR